MRILAVVLFAFAITFSNSNLFANDLSNGLPSVGSPSVVGGTYSGTVVLETGTVTTGVFALRNGPTGFLKICSDLRCQTEISGLAVTFTDAKYDPETHQLNMLSTEREGDAPKYELEAIVLGGSFVGKVRRPGQERHTTLILERVSSTP